MSRPRVTAAVGAWVAFVLVTERWREWGDGVRLLYATDVEEYEKIARAAPGFPKLAIQIPHADRWMPEWTVGVIHKALGLGLHPTYRLLTYLTLVATITVVVVALRRLGVGTAASALAAGAFIASAYPVRYLLDAPGMLTDALFVLGLALASLAFEEGWAIALLAALALASLGRQTGVPLGVVAAVCVAVDSRWRGRRTWAAPLALLVPLAVYVIQHETSSSFAKPGGRGFVGMTVGGAWSYDGTVSHVGRCVVVLAIPAALLLLGLQRGGGRPVWGPLVLGLCVVVQALALAPDWSHAEPRLAGIALPALVIALAPALDRARLRPGEAWLVAAGIALASLHHLYAYPVTRTAEWATLVALGCVLVLVPALRRPSSTLWSGGA